MSKTKLKILYTILFAAALFALVAALLSTPFTAYAQDGDEDTFEAVFPTANYFQSQDPTLVAANENYLVAYDLQQKRLYVRSEQASTYFYDISALFSSTESAGANSEVADDPSNTKSVTDLLMIGSHAFIVLEYASDPMQEAKPAELYSLDLADPDGAPEKTELPSPRNAYGFASDGENLYAKNVAGELAIYNERLELVRGDIRSDDLAGKTSFAGYGDRIYIFTIEIGEPYMYIYDTLNGRRELRTPSKFVRKAYVGDVIFAQLSNDGGLDNHNKVLCLDRETGEELYTSNFMPDSFCAFKSKLYSIIDGSIVGYDLNASEEGEYSLDPAEVISMAGKDFAHLNAPEDLTFAADKLAVADAKNNRIALVDIGATNAPILPYDLGLKPIRLAADDGKLFALLENGNIASYDIANGELTPSTTFNAPEEGEPMKFVDVLRFDSTLYALGEDGLYIYAAGDFLLAAELVGARRLTAAKDGNSLYALTDGEIIMLNASGAPLPSKLEGNFEGATDIAADYVGNIYVIYPSKVECYKNNVSSLELTSEIPLRSSVLEATATSCTLSDGELFFSAQQSFVGKLKVESVNSDGYIPPALPIPDEHTGFGFLKLKEGATSFFIPAADGRADSAIPATSNVLLALNGLGDPAEGLVYAMDSDKMFLIPSKDFDVVEPTSYQDKAYLMKENGRMFSLPYFDDLAIQLAKGEQGIWAVSDCAGYDGNKWMIVRYDSKLYFVDPDCLQEDLAPPDPVDPDDPSDPDAPVSDEPLFGRAKASRVGGTVNIYGDMSESETLARVVDGKKVEILGKSGDYYQVKFGDVIGFMRVNEVKIGGLTTVQIIAIVLSVMVLLAGTGIFISIFGIKKKNDGEEQPK